MKKSELIQLFDDAEMILIGLGEDFDCTAELKDDDFFNKKRDELLANNLDSYIPALMDYVTRDNSNRVAALNKLHSYLEGRNYYVISTSTSSVIHNIEWDNNRLVMPCGGAFNLQCSNLCEEGLVPTSDELLKKLNLFFEKDVPFDSPKCDKCGDKLLFNNIYLANYDEKGYLKQWNKYKTWLQATVNKKVLLLELGVSIQCPTVIRFPFEKVAFYNNKCKFIRVNDFLYQMPEGLGEKGISIKQNAIDWINNL